MGDRGIDPNTDLEDQFDDIEKEMNPKTREEAPGKKLCLPRSKGMFLAEQPWKAQRENVPEQPTFDAH